ncbi:SWIB/MDM2 domain superfamily protein [Klebsormidium nitens]|uniref:SWIB/MDM2 domain superfamily protein n=1 Tax=Klebsormidium nitens TaxID=105231 RepID=A0A1Y1ILD1_KLENI|nr:SWIB/MDM2 domain superfamily protein [Klebsormidium nitens]|eukprot:GAQ90942.1 SWIB/MDM2 domain superfamily protein [Klebsormidium nitens]
MASNPGQMGTPAFGNPGSVSHNQLTPDASGRVSPIPFPGFTSGSTPGHPSTPVLGGIAPGLAPGLVTPPFSTVTPSTDRLPGLSASANLRGLTPNQRTPTPGLPPRPTPPSGLPIRPPATASPLGTPALRPGVVGGTPSRFSTPQTGPATGKKRGRPGLGSGITVVKTAEALPAAKRKKKKAAEKQIPERIAAFVPESRLYSQLLELEKRVDATIARKKLDIQEALKIPQRTARTLRVYVFNTSADQPAGGRKKAAAKMDPPSWTLHLTGRLLAPPQTPPNPQTPSLLPRTEDPKFSSFFKKITIELDKELYPEEHTIVWEGARAAGDTDAFEVKRRGAQEFVAKITLEMNYVPERYKLAEGLANLVGIEVDTRPRIIAALWQYIKEKKLQDGSDPTCINADAPLRALFGPEEKLKFAGLAQKLTPHLAPAPPIVIEHRVKLGGQKRTADVCYDITVDAPVALQREMAAFLSSLEKHRDIDAQDSAIAAAIRKINEHRRRRAFYLGFSHSPVDFINGVIASQTRDLKLANGETGRSLERERRSDFYTQAWVEDAVVRYLNRRLATGADSQGGT